MYIDTLCRKKQKEQQYNIIFIIVGSQVPSLDGIVFQDNYICNYYVYSLHYKLVNKFHLPFTLIAQLNLFTNCVIFKYLAT